MLLPAPASLKPLHPRAGVDFRNILFATDFSPCSEAAVPFIAAIADRYGSTVHVLHVIGDDRLIDENGIPWPDVEGSRQAAQLQMDSLTQSADFKDILHTQTIETGDVWKAVSRCVSGLHIDLIVVGTHGRRGLQHLVLGSVAEQVFRRAACPVLTIGPQVHKKGLARGRMDAVLYATDFSSASLLALEHAVFLARTNYAELILFHALKLGELLPEVEDALAQIKKQLADLMAAYPDVDYRTVAESGLPSELILLAAEETKADLIVMGAHRGASASAHTPWAVAHEVVCRAPCPVLTVRNGSKSS